jgi:hypothetical protein
VDDLPKFLETLRAKLKVGWLPSGRHVMAEGALESARLVRWCGLALVAGGVLLAVATPLHPSRETPATIISGEVRLVASHVLSTLSSLLVLLGLPGLFVAHRAGMGRLGFVGFVGAFTGTYLLAVSGNFGFLAPVLAKESPAVIDAILLYPPVLGLNGLAVFAFVVGYALFGIAMTRTTALPRLSGMLVAVGAPAYLLGGGIAQLVSAAFWAVAVLGSASLGFGLAWPGYRLWHTPTGAE